MSLEKMMEPTGEMAPEQISAIKRSIEIGSLLVNDHPEIAKLYRDGMTHSGIAENLDVKVKYGASDKVAETSIHYAIKGHAEGFGTESYDGLIKNLDELTGLQREHYAGGGKKTAEEGTGIHGLTSEQKSEYSRKGGRKTAELGLGVHGYNPETGERYAVENGRIGGRKGGRKSAELGLGAHGINPETGERYAVENGRKATELGSGAHGINPETGERYVVEGGRIGGRISGRKTALARGQTLWREEETERAYLLSLEPEYQHQKGSWKGKGDYKTIAQVLNDDYHNGEDVRSPGSVRSSLSKYKKTLGN